MPARALVMVETSGVALPAAVARSVRLAAGVTVDGTVVLVDAETVRARADDRYVGDTVLRQLAEADLLLLNKVDLVDADALGSVRAWLRGIAPRAAIVEAVEAEVPPQVVLGIPDASDASDASASSSPASAASSRPTSRRSSRSASSRGSASARPR